MLIVHKIHILYLKKLFDSEAIFFIVIDFEYKPLYGSMKALAILKFNANLFIFRYL